MKESSPNLRIVKVIWLDTTSFLGWFPPTSAKVQTPMVSEAIGYLVWRDSDKVVLAMMVATDGEVNTLSVIPNGSIIKFEEAKKIQWT